MVAVTSSGTPFVIGNSIVSSMTFFNSNSIPQIPGENIAKKWNQRQLKKKKKEEEENLVNYLHKL